MSKSKSDQTIQKEQEPDKSSNPPAIVPLIENVFCGIGVFLVLMSGGLIVTYIGEIVSGTTRHGVASQLGLIVFLCGIVFAGGKMIQGRLTEHNAVKQLKEEQLILNRAKSSGGALTVSQTALDCKLRIADAKKAFERLALSGVCRVDVTDRGELCYRFPSFEKPCSNEDKRFILEMNEEMLKLEEKQS